MLGWDTPPFCPTPLSQLLTDHDHFDDLSSSRLLVGSTIAFVPKGAPVRYRLSIIATVLVLASVALGQQVTDWAMRDYTAPADQVFAAALRSIQAQRHEVKSKDDTNHTVDLHVGITAWSWGYNMRLAGTPISQERCRVIVGVSRSGGNALSWGSGKKEVRKILAGIDAELVAQKAGAGGQGDTVNADSKSTSGGIVTPMSWAVFRFTINS